MPLLCRWSRSRPSRVLSQEATLASQRQGPLLSLSFPSSRIKITSLFLHSRMQEMTSKARGQVEHSLFH